MSNLAKNRAGSFYVETFNVFKIVSALWRQLTLTHFKNIFKDAELDKKSVVEDFSVTAKDDKSYKFFFNRECI